MALSPHKVTGMASFLAWGQNNILGWHMVHQGITNIEVKILPKKLLPIIK